MSNIDELRGKVAKLLALLEDPHPGLSSWCGFYGEVTNEIMDFLLGDALPTVWKKALGAGWRIVPCSCTCGGRFAWLKPRPSGAHEMFGCICHTIPDVEPTQNYSMIEYIAEIQRQFIETYGFAENPEKKGVPMGVPDGTYPMIIGGKLDIVRIENDKIHCCNFENGK